MYDGLTDPLGQSQVLPYMKGLSKNYQIDILGFEKEKSFKNQKLNIKNKLIGYDINWIPLKYTKNPPIFSTIYDFLRAWVLITKLSRQENYNLIHCRSSAVGPLALMLQKRLKSKLLFDMRGWWADEKKESGNWASFIYVPIYKFYKLIEKKLFKSSDIAISLTHAGAKEISSANLKEDFKTFIIPTCVDFKVFKKFDETIRLEVRKELEIGFSETVLLYSGSLGGNYSMDIIFGFYKSLKRYKKNLKILFLTKDEQQMVHNEARDSGIDISNIRVISSSYDQVHRYLMAGDFGFVNYLKTFSAIGRSPTKLGEYWACGLPVIGQKNIGDLDYLLDRYPLSGLLINKIDKKSFDEVTDKIKNLNFDKELLREYSRDYYDLNKGIKSYEKVYETILAN